MSFKERVKATIEAVEFTRLWQKKAIAIYGMDEFCDKCLICSSF